MRIQGNYYQYGGKNRNSVQYRYWDSDVVGCGGNEDVNLDEWGAVSQSPSRSEKVQKNY